MSNTNSDITNTFLYHLQKEKRYSDHTITSYKTDLNQFCNFLLQNYEIAQPHLADFHIIRSWIANLSENHVSTRSISRKIACLRSFYKFLSARGIVQVNPMQKIIAPKTRKSIPVFIEESSITILLDQFSYEDSFSGLRDKLVLELLYGTGIRLSEIINLNHKDIDLFSAQIKVTGKGNKQRLIPLNKSLLQLIGIYISKKLEIFKSDIGAFIVTDKGEDTYPVYIYRLVKKYLSEIDTLEKKSPHILRHTFATHLLNKGAELNAIKDLLGHSSLSATQVYTHNSLDRIKAIFDQAHPKA
jgi:integrase/recombinase XerC